MKRIYYCNGEVSFAIWFITWSSLISRGNIVDNALHDIVDQTPFTFKYGSKREF